MADLALSRTSVRRWAITSASRPLAREHARQGRIDTRPLGVQPHRLQVRRFGFLGPLHQPRPQRVPLNVPRDGQEVRVFLHRKALEPPLIKVAVPDFVVVLLPAADMGHRQPLHEAAELPIDPRLEKQVPVVGHEAIGEQLHRLRRQRLGHCAFEGEVVFVLVEDLPPTDAPVEDVEHDPCGGFASGSSHAVREVIGARPSTKSAPVPFSVPTPALRQSHALS